MSYLLRAGNGDIMRTDTKQSARTSITGPGGALFTRAGQIFACDTRASAWLDLATMQTLRTDVAEWAFDLRAVTWKGDVYLFTPRDITRCDGMTAMTEIKRASKRSELAALDGGPDGLYVVEAYPNATVSRSLGAAELSALRAEPPSDSDDALELGRITAIEASRAPLVFTASREVAIYDPIASMQRPTRRVRLPGDAPVMAMAPASDGAVIIARQNGFITRVSREGGAEDIAHWALGFTFASNGGDHLLLGDSEGGLVTYATTFKKVAELEPAQGALLGAVKL